MIETSDETSLDPRIRRTRKLLQDSLSALLESKSFSDLSITDICKQADIARVTFYQHYENKEALLVASVADFFTGLYKTVDQDALDRYLETGEAGAINSTRQVNSAEPTQMKLISVALQYTGDAVRKLAISSFLETYSQHETALDERETQVLATFYVGGILTLLEHFLSGQVAISRAEFQTATLTLLRTLRQGAVQSNILHGLGLES